MVCRDVRMLRLIVGECFDLVSIIGVNTYLYNDDSVTNIMFYITCTVLDSYVVF